MFFLLLRHFMQHVPIQEVQDSYHANGFLSPNMSTLHPCSWLKKTYKDQDPAASQSKTMVGSVICDLLQPDEKTNPASPRALAKRMFNNLQRKHRLKLYSGFEPEYRLFQKHLSGKYDIKPDSNSGRVSKVNFIPPMPITEGPDMHKTSQTIKYEKFILDLDKNTSLINVDVQDYLHESGSGQLESPLMPKFGIESADNYFMFKQAAREIADQHGMTLSFMTSPLLNESGSGNHFNCSLWDIFGQRNAFFDSDGEFGMVIR